MKNVFLLPEVANDYDDYYQTEFGQQVDSIEKVKLKNLLQTVPRTEMLELGCGTGHWTEFFAALGFKITALDNSKQMLAHASVKNINATFQEGDAQNLPFDNAHFSVVASITMLEFVNDQDQVLKEMYRVLKPKGYLLLGCLNAESLLAKNKADDDTFREAEFLNTKQLEEKLSIFGDVKFESGVYLSNDFKIRDNLNEKNIEPVFIGALVQKQ